MKCGRPWRSVAPKNTPVAAGLNSGQAAPSRCGSIISPLHPAGARAARAIMSSYGSRPASRGSRRLGPEELAVEPLERHARRSGSRP